MWKKKTLSQIEWWEFHLWRSASSYITSPALSDNQCHISAWKVMNKVLAVVLTVRYSRWAECVCVSVHVHIAFWCVFSVPYEVRARRGWVMSYSLRETDGDAGVYISTVCVSAFVSPRALDMPPVFHERLQHGARLSPFSIWLYGFVLRNIFSISRVLKYAMVHTHVAVCRSSVVAIAIYSPVWCFKGLLLTIIFIVH